MPRLFGFSKLADGLYVQSSMAPKLRLQVTALLATAEQRVSAFFGGLQHMPRVLICADDACYSRIGGGAGSGTGTLGSFALVVSRAGINPVLIAEALSHVELHGRVGFWNTETGAVPAWFDEGAAVLAADDRQYLAPARPGRDRCAVGPLSDMPTDPVEWRDKVAEQGDLLYASAACQVDLWMLAQGGPPAVPALLAKIHDGMSFDSLYDPKH